VGAPHHAKNIMTTTGPLEMLHMYLFGPITYISIGDNKYGLVIIDDYSRFTWVFFLHDKSEAQEVLKKFLKRAQIRFDAKVKKIRSGNGSEFKNTQVEDYLHQEGIKHEFLTPYTPQQNGVSKRKNRTLIESARTMLNDVDDLDVEQYDLDVEQYDLDDVDDEEAPCDALRTISIGDVRPQEANEDQPSSNEVAPPTQKDDQDQEGEQHEDGDQVKEMSNDQGGVEQDEDDDDQKKLRSSPLPHPRVRQTIQHDHPVNNILCAIEKGVTTRSRVATFCEHYSFVSSFEPIKMEDAL
jgi:hypothetical protein